MTAIDLTALRIATTPINICPGSGSIVRAESTDGNGVAPCPTCHRHRLTHPAIDDYRTVEVHKALWGQL